LHLAWKIRYLIKHSIDIHAGTSGIGAETIKLLASHNPAHIYFSGRNVKAGQTLIDEVKAKNIEIDLTFIEMDLSSMPAVKAAAEKFFTHSRLDILILNAGIMKQPAVLSSDGYEIQFATNHLGHAMLTQVLLPTLLRTAQEPNSDVRIISLTSLGYALHERDGISFAELDSHSTMSRKLLGGWVRYGQSKLANILYPAELARRFPDIISVSVHPGVVETPLVHNQSWPNRALINVSQWLTNNKLLEPDQGAWNTVWAAAAATKSDLRNGGFYTPIGVEGSESVLDKTAKDEKLAAKLYEWTEGVLAKF
jgi:NAD(P)-dependent dehydrogenase (short-subunit alcohol dehydrogenase family)